MTKKLLALFLCILMLVSLAAGCAKPSSEVPEKTKAPESPEAPEVPEEPEEMVYTTLYASEVSTLNYLTTGTQWDQYVGANVIDTLVEYDNFGQLKPGLAESWEVSDDQLTWTFHLREGVKWYDYQGNEVAEVTADDFVAAAKYVMTPEYESSTFYQMEIIKNATEYYDPESPVKDFSEVGVKAIDKYTLQYTLVAPTPYFLSCLTYVCFMPAYGPQLEELGADFATDNEKMYYCGAYILSTFEPQVEHIYTKNENNWDADNVFITKIHRRYNAESATLAPVMVLRGEIDYADIDTSIVDDWLNNHPELLSKDRAIPDYSYFYCFNFNPTYDEEWDPENWKIAVNNENFRKSIMSGFDRLYAMRAIDPNDPESVLQNTIAPKGFASVNGVDFSSLEPFKGVEENYFNEAKALEYKAKAIEELTAAGATFPVKMVLTYRSDDDDWENEYIYLKQQLEALLGTDYIECILNPGTTDNFLTNTRRAGKYSFMRCNWGADFQDPSTWTDPFAPKFDSEAGKYTGNSYNFMDINLNEDNQNETTAVLKEYYALVDAAKAETADMAARYNAFAKAERFLIDHAVVVPYFIYPASYVATKLNAFEGQFASFGVSILRYKGQKVYDHYITPEEYEANYEQWLANIGG
ncbi:MAG: Oligopeptide-binding protein AmiA precursor [Firmicutes bacterium ADurb.Bin182]|nr:MAG: Oligopeptide-binding protein AmiA precursor [Firmicutes bacterium ADurb.Bin182]